jgi:hypothetical protein
MTIAEVGVELGPMGLDWVKKSLSRGLAISEAFLELETLSSMACVALVSPDTPPQLLRDPEQWQLHSRPASTLPLLAAFLEERTSAEGGVLVVENELARPSDPWIKERGLDYPHFTRGDELYHWVALEKAVDAEIIDGFLGESTHGVRTNGFVLQMSSAEFGERVSTEVAPEKVAEAVDSVVVSAYDDFVYIAAFPAAKP